MSILRQEIMQAESRDCRFKTGTGVVAFAWSFCSMAQVVVRPKFVARPSILYKNFLADRHLDYKFADTLPPNQA